MNHEHFKAYSKYIGVPYVLKGRDMTGWDCYGLYRYVYQEQFGVLVGSFDTEYTDKQNIPDAMRKYEQLGWQRQTEQTEGTGIVFNIAGQPLHCGYVLAPGLMLHCLKGRETCIERFDSPAWEKRIEGLYKWN